MPRFVLGQPNQSDGQLDESGGPAPRQRLGALGRLAGRAVPGARGVWGRWRASGASGAWGVPRASSGWAGVVLLIVIGLPCVVSLPWSLTHYEGRAGDEAHGDQPPSWAQPMGSDSLGRSLVWRCLLGGAISLCVGVSAVVIAVVIGVSWGALAGYLGGRTDAIMMRAVDVLYGLPYILLVVMVDLAFQPMVEHLAASFLATDQAAAVSDVCTLLAAIGAVSWLTMARVIRGQVLSLRTRPFIEAAYACGVGPGRILRVHLLPNLIGPIVVYMSLTVPAAILQESFLSFLGIGIQPPLPSWGNLAAAGVEQLPMLSFGARPDWTLAWSHPLTLAGQLADLLGQMDWWLLVFPCLLLGLTLLGLNFVGEALRRRYDPAHASA